MATVTKTPLLVALGIYLSGGTFDLRAFGLTSVLAAALWAVLYALNESYDLALESDCVVSRKKRAILYAAAAAIVAASALLSPWLLVLFVLMCAGQLAYCVPPVRLKRYWWAAPLLSGVVNPILRLECGAIWGAHAIPVVAVCSIAFMHLSSAIRTRSLLRGRDQGFGYRIAPKSSDKFGAVSMTLGLLGICVLCYQRILPPSFILLTVLSAAYAAYAWSGRVNNIAQLRRGWIWFAILSVVALAGLFFKR